MSKEQKNLPFKIEAKGIATNEQGQEVGRIEAYGAVFNVVDEGNDRIMSQAFTRTIKNSKARAQARQKPYVLKMLWQHKADEVIGGWADLSEDDFGLRCTGDVLLSTQRGREYYELAKAGMIDEFSIIYDIPSGGAKYDKSGVRELTELRLFSIDPVTFAMCDETYLVGVKSSDGKGKGMAVVGEPGSEPLVTPEGSSVAPKRKLMHQKTLLEHYNQEMAEHLLSDWQDVFLCSLTCAILDALKSGDQPQADISQALDDFKALVLEKFVVPAKEVGLSQYLQDCSYVYSPADYTMQYGSESSPSRGYMGSTRLRIQKAGRAISAANAGKLQGHIDTVQDIANKMDTIQEHAQSLRAVADDMAQMVTRPEDETDSQDSQDMKNMPHPSEEEPKTKAASQTLARGATPHSEASTVDEQELEAELRRLRTLREPAPTH